MVCHWVYRGSSYAVYIWQVYSLVKLFSLSIWGVAWDEDTVLFITVLFISGARIYQETCGQ